MSNTQEAVDHVVHGPEDGENIDPSGPSRIVKEELCGETTNVIGSRLKPIMVVDGDEMLEVTEVVSSSTTNEDYLPRTRAQSCFMADSEPEVEEGHLTEARRTPLLENQNAIPEMNASKQFPVETSAGTEEKLSPISVKQEATDDVIELRPTKRKRVVLDAVVVPTLASILAKHPRVITKEEKEKQMKKLQNPKVKKAKGTFSLVTVWDRLNGIGREPYPIPLEHSIASVMVSRDFLSSVYGGNQQQTFPSIAQEKIDVHGLHDFMYPNLLFNPCAPQIPGAPGLFFEAPGHPAGDWPKVQRVITRIDSNAWHYLGQYKLSPAPSLTKEEWANEQPQVRNTWATEICKRGWGATVRARIYLRKQLKREFTEAELDQERHANRKYDITPEEVGKAFLRGEESIAVWTMQCIGYDADFQRNLAEKFPAYEPQPKDSRSKKSVAKDSALKEPKSKAGQKRKRREDEFFDNDDDDDDDDDDD